MTARAVEVSKAMFPRLPVDRQCKYLRPAKLSKTYNGHPATLALPIFALSINISDESKVYGDAGSFQT